MKNIYTAIDIGSDSVKIVVGEIFNNKLNILASTSTPSEGVKKGKIVNEEEVVNTIKRAVFDINEKLSVEIDKVMAVIPAYDVKIEEVIGYSTISNEMHKVTSNDILNAIQSSIYNRLQPGYELISVLPLHFYLDDKQVKFPRNYHGSRLKVEGILLTVPKKNVYSIVNAIEKAGLQVIDITLSSIAEYYEFLNNTQNELDIIKVALNIGHETTNIAIFNDNKLIATEVIPIGASYVEHDLAYVYALDDKKALELKKMFITANEANASPNEVMEVVNLNGEKIRITQLDATKVAEARIEEILMIAKSKIRELTNEKINYIIISGGITKLEDFDVIAKRVFGDIAHLGELSYMGARDIIFAPCTGMIQYFHNKLILRGKRYSFLGTEKEKILTTPEKKYSILGKVFSFFVEK